MSLRTYREVRPWARSIARAVENRDMPPWDADPGYGPFTNDISLSDAEIEAITNWAGSGAPRGDGDEPVYEPPASARQGEWAFGEPDWVYEFDPFKVAADGPDEFAIIPVDTGWDQDRWIRAVEVQPRRPRSRPPLHPLARRPGRRGPGRLDRRLGRRCHGQRVPFRHSAPGAQGPEPARRLPLPPERHRRDRQDAHRHLVRRA